MRSGGALALQAVVVDLVEWSPVGMAEVAAQGSEPVVGNCSRGWQKAFHPVEAVA